MREEGSEVSEEGSEVSEEGVGSEGGRRKERVGEK